MFEFNANGYGILQIRPNQSSRPLYHVAYWSDTYYYKILSVKIVFLVNDGLFEHFLSTKFVKTLKYVELKISNYHSELMGTCSFERAIVCIHT